METWWLPCLWKSYFWARFLSFCPKILQIFAHHSVGPMECSASEVAISKAEVDDIHKCRKKCLESQIRNSHLRWDEAVSPAGVAGCVPHCWQFCRTHLSTNTSTFANLNHSFYLKQKTRDLVLHQGKTALTPLTFSGALFHFSPHSVWKLSKAIDFSMKCNCSNHLPHFNSRAVSGHPEMTKCKFRAFTYASLTRNTGASFGRTLILKANMEGTWLLEAWEVGSRIASALLSTGDKLEKQWEK